MTPGHVARSSRLVVLLLQGIAGLALVLMMGHTVANALMRYAASSPIAGTNEYVSFWYLPTVALLGFYLAQRGGAHIEARLVFDRLPQAGRIEVQLLGQVLTIVLSCGFAYYGLVEALDAYSIGQTGGVTEVITWPVMFLVPLAFGLLAVQLTLDAVAVIRRRDPAATSHGSQQNAQSSTAAALE